VRRASTRTVLLLGIAAVAIAPSAALAGTAKEQELEARIAALERAFGAMQGELQTAKAENVQLRETAMRAEAQVRAIAQAPTHPASIQPVTTQLAAAQPVPARQTPATAPDGFTAGNGATRIRIGGFLKTVATFSRWDDGDVAANTFGRDFYLPQAIPLGGVRESIDHDFSAKQTRLWLNLETQVAGHTLKGYLETDFQTAPGTQGSERTTNGYNLALRRAYVQFDKLLVGQDWSTFQNVAVLPETTDFIGPTEGTVFIRQPLVRYSVPLGGTTTLHVSAENPESATASLGSPSLVENDDDSLPDFAVRLHHTGGFGEVSLAGLVRQIRVDNGTVGDTSFGYGASLAAKIFLDKDQRYDVRMMATYGTGVGRYVGLNFAPDAVYVPGADGLSNVRNFAAFTSVRLGWTPRLRSTLTASYQDAMYADTLPLASLLPFNDKAFSLAGNLFWSPVAGLDLGVEYRHAERRLISGAAGQLDRLEFAAKYSF